MARLTPQQMIRAQAPHRCWAEIDLAALERNVGRIRNALPPYIRYIAVVKADAYGHGLPQAVTRLMQCGADAFAVANVREAEHIRESGSGWPILVLGALLPGEESQLVDKDLIATVSEATEIDRLESVAMRANTRVRYHLKIDTGMGRLGVWHEQANALMQRARAASHLALEGVYTHFSSADTDPAFTRLQRQRFIETLHRIGLVPTTADTQLWIHADNSAGLESFSAHTPFNAVRIGLLQFGHPPATGSLLEGLRPEPVLSLHCRVGLLKQLPAGTPVSYRQSHRLQRPSRLAVLTAGYGDGIPTACSNRGQVLINGQRFPIVGRITMDQTIVDVTTGYGIECGARATFFGMQGTTAITINAFSDWADSIPYESLCRISKRVPRIYQSTRV